jgi:transposase-like protein
MRQLQSWREVLGSNIEILEERQRIAREIGVNPVTLVRWVKQDSTPRPHHLQRLVSVLPQQREVLISLIEQEFPGFKRQVQNGMQERTLQEIPLEFFTRMMHTQAMIPRALRFTSLCDLILGQILHHFDPSRFGLAVIVATCMPPSQGQRVRSLRERIGRGTPPWENYLEQQAVLLGIESLAGYAVNAAHIVFNPDLRMPLTTSPGYRGQGELSAVAAPIMRGGNIAGSLLMSSTQLHFFSSEQLQIIQSYAELLGLAFEDSDFYRAEQIDLWPLPKAPEQQTHLKNFRRLVLDLLMQATREQRSLSISEAELLVWKQFEAAFFDRYS